MAENIGAENEGDGIFDVQSESREGYKEFIKDIIQEYGRENINFEFRTLPKVHKSQVFVKKMVGDLAAGDYVVSLVFQGRDMYYIAWGVDDDDADVEQDVSEEETNKKWFILKEYHTLYTEHNNVIKNQKEESRGEKNKKKKNVSKKGGKGAESEGRQAASAPAPAPPSGYLVEQLAGAKVMNIESNYCRLVATAGRVQDLLLGKDALRKALVTLSKAGQQLNDRLFAKSCLTIMQMVPEPARYKPLLDFIFEHYYTGKRPALELVSQQKNWSSKSSMLQALLKVKGPFNKEQLELLSEHWTLVLED